LLTRKEKLKRILPSRSTHVLYVNHSRGNGTALYRLACQLDLEGIVAKRADHRYEDNPNGRDHSISLALLVSLPVAIAQAHGRSVRASHTTNTTPPSRAAD
jgi:hypothetical protein